MLLQRMRDAIENILVIMKKEMNYRLVPPYSIRVNPTIGGLLCENQMVIFSVWIISNGCMNLILNNLMIMRRISCVQERLSDGRPWMGIERKSRYTTLETMYEGKKYTLIQDDCMGNLVWWKIVLWYTLYHWNDPSGWFQNTIQPFHTIHTTRNIFVLFAP